MKGKSFGFALRILVFGSILALMVAVGLLSACRKGEKLAAGLPHDSVGVTAGAHASFPGAPDGRKVSSITGPGGDDFSFEPLGEPDTSDAKGLDAYELTGKEEDGKFELSITGKQVGGWKYAIGNVYYNAENWNPVDFRKGGMFKEDESELAMAPFYKLKGKFGFWIGMRNFDEKEAKTGGDVCTVVFAHESWEPPREPKDAPDEAGDAVFDLEQVETNGRYISWGEVNRGDGCRDGVVGMEDITPLVLYNGDTIANWPMKDPVDYDDDGTIESGGPGDDYGVWYASFGEAVDGYKVLMRTSQNGSVVHTVTVAGPSYSLRTSKFVYHESPETKYEPSYFYRPSGFYWTDNGAVGYECNLVEDDGQNAIDEGTWWVSVEPYDGNDIGTESARQEITIDDPEGYMDGIYILSLDEEYLYEDPQSISPGDTARIQIWVLGNELEFYHMPSCRLKIEQDANSNIVKWAYVTFHEFDGANPSPFLGDILEQGSENFTYYIGWNPLLRYQADSRTADMNFTFYNPQPSYGVSAGTLGYFAYMDIPTNTGTSGEFTVTLIIQDASPPYTMRTFYEYGNDYPNDITYFNSMAAASVTVSVS